ncbi:MAG TPA: hypothetical protein PLY61_10115, partial [Anaerohalosphaeraceae bacterium]|nr:hypothetical protein [Anaerohalosphaeraceae bacterium]
MVESVRWRGRGRRGDAVLRESPPGLNDLWRCRKDCQGDSESSEEGLRFSGDPLEKLRTFAAEEK